MASLNGFDANEVEPAGDFGPVPAGMYEAVIIDSNLKPTKAGTGSYLELTFQIAEGEYAGRFLWARLNLENLNPKAVEIARGELSAICRAVGVHTPKDSTELHNLPLVINVKCRKRADTDEIANEIKGYFPTDPPAQNSSQSPDQTPPKAPWQRAS